MNILLIDNRDSFTFNLADACARLGAYVKVVRNTIAAEAALERAEREGMNLLLSPGPGHPRDAGCTMALIALAKGRIPVIGVCLGHQAMVLEAGGTVERAPAIVHGKTSRIEHDASGPFKGLASPMAVGRYHSLCTPNPPANFTVHAAIDGMAMAISDARAKQVGVQFHPESILTPMGDQLLAGLLRWTEALRSGQGERT
ncbi:aminodeoxychorismate/anthranilate synthase component II [Sphingomonas sp.]|uniref:anthranilate synthase component II n=1 Tax=Sphingomonas sp. TaxID=28214 RepID=UPI00286B6707|nr:aminodeoxychorismate/anthranilate synthase component II [Sphingomonas sp.]